MVRRLHLTSRPIFARRLGRTLYLSVLLTVMFALPLHTVSLAQTEDADGPVYIVQPGDTLYSIALSFGVGIEDLQLANDITDADVLGIGQTLTIPGFEGVSGVLTTRDIALGDTLDSLVLVLGTTPDVLIRLNRVTNPALLYVGQSLIYPEPGAGAGLAQGRMITITPADTLLGLAARYRQHPFELAQLNNLEHPATLFVGRRLVVPVPEVALSGLSAPMIGLQLTPEHPGHQPHCPEFTLGLFDPLCQGHPIGIKVQTEPGTVLSGMLGDWPLNFAILNDSEQLALQGVHTFAEPGLYPLEITATAPDGRTTGYLQFIPVADAGYQYQQIVLTGETANLLSPEITIPELERIQATTQPFNPLRYWEETWVSPVPMDRVTTPFGIRRSYNGGPYNSFHGGLDLGGSATTPVLAAAAGVVVMAETLQVRGNAIIVDHGWGVYTGYWHLSQMLVEPGQQVTTGQQLGFIGSTGLSTGNHLHWEVWVGGYQVDPLIWLGHQFP